MVSTSSTSDYERRRVEAHRRRVSIRCWSSSPDATAAGRAPARTPQLGVDDPVRLTGPVVPRGDHAVQLLAQRGQPLVRGRLARGRTRRTVATASSAPPAGARAGHATWSGSSSPGMPRKSISSSLPISTCALVAELAAVEDHPVERRLAGQRREAALLLVDPRPRPARPGRAARPRRRRCRPRRGSAGRARGRAASSIAAACASSVGTEGRNTDAVSPRRRARTNRPTACAKNSGVDVVVA